MAGDRAPDGRNPAGPSVGLDAELDQAVGTRDGLAYLILFTGNIPGRMYVIKRTSVVVGRSAEADVQINDGSVSSQHARIEQKGHSFEITDLHSTNGTFVGGKRVSRSALRTNDRVTLGNAEFMFLLDRPTSATIQLPEVLHRAPAGATSALVPAMMPIGPPRLVMPAPPSRAGDPEPSFADFVRKIVKAYHFVRERSVLVSVCLAGGVVLGLFSIFVAPPGAAAVAEVKLLPHLTLASKPDSDEHWQNNDQESSQWVKAAERTMTQRELVRATATKLAGEEPSDSRVHTLQSQLKVEETGDHVFRATYRDRISARPPPLPFLTALLQGYVQTEIGRSLRELSAKVDFLRDQLKTVEADMASASNERAAFREANADRLPEDEQQTHTSRFGLETRRTELTAQVHQLQAELSAEQNQLKANRPEAQRKFLYSEAYRQPLTEVSRKLSEAYARGLGEDHPEVKQLKEEKQRLEALSKAELQSCTPTFQRESDPNYQAALGRIEKLQAELAAARANLGETDRSLGQVRQVVQDLPRVEQRLTDLDHRQTATVLLHGDLFAKLKQAEIQLNLEKVSAESRFDISPPRLELPGKATTLGTRGLLGLLIGVFGAALAIAFQEIRVIVSQTVGGRTIIPQVIPPRDRIRNTRF